MKMNKKITLWLKRSFTGRILFAMSLATSLLLTACVREMEVDDAPFRPGNRATATLTFDIKTSSTDVKTRSALDAGALKLETIWIGVFDTKTGEMLGYMADRPRKSDNTRVRMNDDSGTWTVEGMDIWYYDNNPEVYIASVVNYEFVQARKVGDAETTDLHKLLGIEFDGNNIPEVTDRITWEDLCAISVDTKSIDAAMKTASSRYGSSPAEELALAMGFFNTSAGVHTTIDREGKTPANARVSLAKNGTQYVSELHPEGRIYLRRMQSDIKVNINFSTYPSSSPVPVPPSGPSGSPYHADVIQEVKSLKYKVINQPVEMYLAEHAVDQIGGSLSGKDNYRSRSANSADWLDDGYISDADWTEIKGSIEEGYSFTYSHYENKHWGIDWTLDTSSPFGPYFQLGRYDEESDEFVPDSETRTWKEYIDAIGRSYSMPTNSLASMVQVLGAHRIREAKLTEGSEEVQPLFKSLSQAENRAFNNNASYFLIEAELTYKDLINGSVATGKYYYTIHEGYTSYADGTALPAASRMTKNSDIYDAICDFQTVRNTKYTYNLTFSGISNIEIQAEQMDYSPMHDDGYTGQTWRTSGDITTIDGAGNANRTGKKGDKASGDIYRYEDPDYNYDYVGYLPLSQYIHPSYLYFIESRKNLKWRLYETRPGERGNSETNYGTTISGSDSQLGWPAINGEMKSFDDLMALPDSDPMKKFYNGIKIHISVPAGDGSNYLEMESVKAMTLEEFISGADEDIRKSYPSSWEFYYFLTVDAYDVSDQIDNYPKYNRGFYFVTEASDSDGCLYAELLMGAEQGAHDRRAVVSGFGPMLLQSFKYYNNYTNVDFNVYSASRNFSDTEYIRWFAGAAFYTAENDDSDGRISGWNNSWNDYKQYYDIYDNAHEPVSYTLYIDGNPKATITWDGKLVDNGGNVIDTENYRHSILYDPQNPGDYLHLNTRTFNSLWYFAWPYNPNELSAGDHALVIEANFEDGQYDYVQPTKIETTLRIIERPFWNFNNTTYPSYLYPEYGDFYTYGSMTTVFGYGGFYVNNTGPTSGLARFYNYNGNNGYASYSSSDNDHDLIRFTVDKHGTFRVRSMLNYYYYTGYKYLYFAARNTGKTDSFYYTSYNNTMDVYFYTHDIIDNFDDGPVEVAFYADNYYSYSNYPYIDIFEIEWITDEDQRPNYPGNISYSNVRKNDTYYDYYIHPYYYYISSRNFYLTPGFVNYFGFQVSNQPDEKKASKYKIGLYDRPNNILNSTPVYEWEIDAEECLTYHRNYQKVDYYVCPLYLPLSEMNRLSYGWYYVAVTPVSEDYREVPVMLSTNNFFRIVEGTENAVEWFDNTDYGNYSNPWYYSSYSGNSYNFRDEAGEWSEFLGLVLHGGDKRSTNTTESTYITFEGTGYPLATSGGQPSDRDYGCYLTFTTDMPGYVYLRASSTGGSQRYFRLYAVENGVPVQKDRVPVAESRAPFRLSTGTVDGLTEFIICPEGGVNLYGARFVHDETVDDRLSLDESTITYSNWSTDPDKPIHQYFYDQIYDYGGDEDEFQGYVYRQFPLESHFETLLSFSDDNPRAVSYKLQLFNEETFNPNDFAHPDFEEEIDAETYRTYTDDSKQVFTYPLFIGNGGNLVTGDYLAFITPVGDPAVYRPASPQFLTLVTYHDWTAPYLDEDGYYDDDPYADIWLSPGIGWIAEEYTTYNLMDDSYEYEKVSKQYKADEYLDCWGLTLRSGTVDNAIYTTDPAHRGADGDTYKDWCIYFPGNGWPKQTHATIGKGRNMSFTTDVAGKVLIFANGANEDRKYGLWKIQGEGAVQIGDSKGTIYNTETAYKDILKPIVLETGSVTGKTDFIICPEGNSFLYSVIFLKEGSPAYEWDWENDGWPGTSDSDDDDADGHSLGRTAPFNLKSAIGLWTDRIPFPKKR